MDGAFTVEWRAFPLRPVPDPTVRFKGTYREAGWRRCGMMTAADGLVYKPWPHEKFPAWSVPALEAGKCVTKQDPSAFERVHLRLYEAFFTDNLDISDVAALTDIVAACGVDIARFQTDMESGVARAEIARDYETAVAEHHVRAIPAVIVPATGRALVGLASLDTYRTAVTEAGR